MAPTNSQPEQAATPITSADFDQNLVNWVKQYLAPVAPLVNALDNVRISYELNALPDVKPWPKERIFCSTEAILAIYNMLSERGLLGSEHQSLQQNIAQMGEADDANIERMLYVPSLVCILQPWDKERCIFHVKAENLSDDLLNAKTSIVANMPQWSMCFNLADQNFLWDNKRICGVIFARYFIGISEQDAGANPEALAQLPDSMEGEGPAVINNLISAVVFEDGSFDLGPFVSLDNNLTFNQFLQNMSNDILNTAKQQQGKLSEDDLNKFKNMAEDTNKRSADLFKYLIYTLQHPELYKNQAGEACTAPKHPQVILFKEGPRMVVAGDVTNITVD